MINDKEAGQPLVAKDVKIDCEECDSQNRCTQMISNVTSPVDSDANSQCALRKKKAIDRIKAMRSVGWMTLLGDSAHNLLDGIALGATKR